MDVFLRANGNSDYFLLMANLEAGQLKIIADKVSFLHIKNFQVRQAFKESVDLFINANLNAIRSARSDSVKQECLQNLKKECTFLNTQNSMLHAGEARLYASVKFVTRDKIVGYIINGVSVALGGLQVVAGLGVIAVSIGTGTIIGTGFGALLVLHGANAVQESLINIITGENSAIGLLKKGYIGGAKCLGFDDRTGQLAYSAMDVGISVYGMARLSLKPKAWRLFHYITSDYVRGVQDMSRFALGVEIYNDSMALKSIYDLNNN